MSFAHLDTLSDRALAASADRVLHAARCMERPHRIDDDLVTVWQGDRGMFTNVAVAFGEAPDWPDVEARIASVVPADRPALLVAAATTMARLGPGWHHVGRPPLMFRPAGARPLSSPVGVLEIGDERGLEAFERTLVHGYPEPDLQPYRFGDVYDTRVLGGPTHFFVVTDRTEPVATASGHVAAGVNLVEMVATRPGWRGRGYGAAATMAAATVDPSLPAVLIASDLGRPVYERLGFEAVSRWTLWFRPGV